MGRADSDCGSGEREGGEVSDDDAFEASLLYRGSIDTRLRARKDMSVAQWDAVRGTAEVIVKKGKAWTTTGFTRGSVHLAFIEEAVFMVEQGSLVMWEGEKVISLLDAYSLVAASPSYGCSWDDFQAYSYLKKLGYIVGRHNVPWTSPKKRPPVLPAAVTDIDSQFAAVDLTNTAQETDNSCEMTTESLSQVRSTLSKDAANVRQSDEGDETAGEEVPLGWPAVLSSQEGDTDLSTGKGHDNKKRTSELKLMYDVHLPNARFKKTNPGLPAFSLCITSNRPPHRAAVQALERCCEGRPVKFASVVCDHVSIFSFDAIDAPTLP